VRLIKATGERYAALVATGPGSVCTTCIRSAVGSRGPNSAIGSMWSVAAGSSGANFLPQMAQNVGVARACRERGSHREV
jgi:hypothetical protein